MSQTFTGVLTVVCCSNCGVHFGVEEAFQKRRREDHRSFYCPNGHGQYYPQKSPEEKLKSEVAQLQLERDNAQTRADFWYGEHGRMERSRRAIKGQLTKTKNRLAAGNCPRCDCHFDDLEAHMAEQHTDYVETEDAGGSE